MYKNQKFMQSLYMSGGTRLFDKGFIRFYQGLVAGQEIVSSRF